MVPARNTINEIFSIVENIVLFPPKNRKAEWITAYLTAHDKCKLWIPAGCLLCSLIVESLHRGSKERVARTDNIPRRDSRACDVRHSCIHICHS